MSASAISAPAALVRVWDIEDKRSRRPTPNPWVVRWKIGRGKPYSRSFPTKALAEDFRARLIVASRQGDSFDTQATGLPLSWVSRPTVTVFEFARSWLFGETDLEPRSRRSMGEALAWFLTCCLRPDAPALSAKAAADARRWLRVNWLQSELASQVTAERARGSDEERDERWKHFFTKWSPALGELDKAMLHSVEMRLRRKLDGTHRASSGARYVKIARQCLREAVRIGILDADPWPPAPKGRGQRKANRLARQKPIEPKVRLRPGEMEQILTALVTHQPASRMYRAMSAVGFYAGLRPSEIRDLTGADLYLPAEGWGSIAVRRADVGKPESGDPKNGPRDVPIPQRLVVILREWILESGAGDGFLFRTRTGRRPTDSNHTRALKRACQKAGLGPRTPYDLRRACATFWDNANVPRSEIARRLGHSLETLERFYLGVASGDEELGNSRIDALLAQVA